MDAQDALPGVVVAVAAGFGAHKFFDWYEQRKVAQLPTEQAQQLVDMLKDKFPEQAAQVAAKYGIEMPLVVVSGPTKT